MQPTCPTHHIRLDLVNVTIFGEEANYDARNTTLYTLLLPPPANFQILYSAHFSTKALCGVKPPSLVHSHRPSYETAASIFREGENYDR